MFLQFLIAGACHVLGMLVCLVLLIASALHVPAICNFCKLSGELAVWLQVKAMHRKAW